MRRTLLITWSFFTFFAGAYVGATQQFEALRELAKPCKALVYEYRMPMKSLPVAECRSICAARERDRRNLF